MTYSIFLGNSPAIHKGQSLNYGEHASTVTLHTFPNFLYSIDTEKAYKIYTDMKFGKHYRGQMFLND
jgi:hypothetical protein